MPGTAAAGSGQLSTEFTERLLLVDINRQALSQAVLVLEDKAGTLYLLSQDLQHWRLRLPDVTQAIEYQGEKYYPLSAILDLSHTYDRRKLTLMIIVQPDALAGSVWDTRFAKIPPPTRSGRGEFINYDVYFADSPELSQRAGQFEIGYFNRYGVGTSNVIADELSVHPRVTRLDTTWTMDFPEKMRSLRMGDAINAPASWGRSVHFGGIQYGTNFATQPDFLIFPMQSVMGQAALPSTVDVFVNNTLISNQSVPPGPFTINNLPIVTGAGEVQLVVRDMLGRQQIITRPFYASHSLLREGLESFSCELGLVRENFGIDSNAYGGWLSSGTYRRGMSDHFTGEFHAEAMQEQATVGAGGDYLISQLGTLSSYIAGSESNTGQGQMLLLGIVRQAHPWSLGVRTQWFSSGFAQLGLQAPQLPPAQINVANLGYATEVNGSFGLAYVEQRNRDNEDARIATFSYSVSLGKMGSLSTTAMRNYAGEVSTTVFVLLSVSLDELTSLSGAQLAREGSNGISHESSATLQRNMPGGEGYGYRLLARSEGTAEAAYSQQSNVATYSIAAAQTENYTSTMMGVSGGVAMLGGDVFMSRRVDQSFAVVRIPDYPGVRILADNQPAGRTNAQGSALIPHLRAYDINTISVDQRDIPMDAEIKATKLNAIPYYRSGIDLEFPIRRSHGATLTILLENGKPMPVGAAVQQVGKKEILTVGYDGEVYIVDLAPTTRLRASWHQQSCEFDVHFSASAEPLPHLGSFICTGVTP